MRGPEAIRLTSARQIETFLLDEMVNIYERARIYDIGDLKIPPSFAKNKTKRKNLLSSKISYVGGIIHKITTLIHDANKVPIMIGGEHTLTYYALKALSSEKPLVLHFDAHRDMKPKYDGIRMCHTTPFYHIVNEGIVTGNNIIQIGIRQTDREENDTAVANRVKTFDAWEIHDSIDNLLKYIRKVTRNVDIYISFDIDVYDLPYVPCTGTPEPFGLNPFEVSEIVKNISPTARLIGRYRGSRIAKWRLSRRNSGDANFIPNTLTPDGIKRFRQALETIKRGHPRNEPLRIYTSLQVRLRRVLARFYLCRLLYCPPN